MNFNNIMNVNELQNMSLENLLKESNKSKTEKESEIFNKGKEFADKLCDTNDVDKNKISWCFTAYLAYRLRGGK